MFVSCKCLNIILKYSGRQLVPTPELSFPNHEFFRDNSLITSTVDDNFLVLKRQPALIDQEIIDIWNITKCINCYQYTYAVSYNKNTDNPDNSNNLEPSIKYLVLNKSFINFDNLPDDYLKLIENLPDDNFKRSILTKDNSKLSDNLRLVVGDNAIPLISTKTLLMTDDNNSHKSIAAAVVDKNYSSLKSDKTIIFSDNLPLITGNSITSCSTTTNLNDNSTFLIGGDNSKISTTIEDNSPIEDDNSANENNIFIKMKNHRDFSDIYNIIVDCDNDSDDIDDNEILMMRKQLLPGVQESLGNLHQQYEAKVKNIKDTIEENIRQYTAKQYEYLENYKDQGHHHYYVLTNKILRNEFKKIKKENNTQVIGDVKSSDIVKGKEEEDDKTELVNSKISPNHSVRVINQDNSIVPGSLMYSDDNNKMTEGKRDIKREKEGGEKKAKRKQMKNHKGDIDDQVIFAIEGMDDDDDVDDDDDDNNMEVEDNNNPSDNEDNDNDDDDGETDDSGQDEGIHIPRIQRGGHPTLAKSLPVAVPNFGFNHRKQRQNDHQQYVDPQDPHNIRASIKALAKSVHGDTVFGDLPRPRFSTEI